jgi:hypothetical protein
METAPRFDATLALTAENAASGLLTCVVRRSPHDERSDGG